MCVCMPKSPSDMTFLLWRASKKSNPSSFTDYHQVFIIHRAILKKCTFLFRSPFFMSRGFMPPFCFFFLSLTFCPFCANIKRLISIMVSAIFAALHPNWKRGTVERLPCTCVAANAENKTRIVSRIISRNKNRFTCYITNSILFIFLHFVRFSGISSCFSFFFLCFLHHSTVCKTSKQIILINLTRERISLRARSIAWFCSISQLKSQLSDWNLFKILEQVFDMIIANECRAGFFCVLFLLFYSFQFHQKCLIWQASRDLWFDPMTSFH